MKTLVSSDLQQNITHKAERTMEWQIFVSLTQFFEKKFRSQAQELDKLGINLWQVKDLLYRMHLKMSLVSEQAQHRLLKQNILYIDMSMHLTSKMSKKLWTIAILLKRMHMRKSEHFELSITICGWYRKPERLI